VVAGLEGSLDVARTPLVPPPPMRWLITALVHVKRVVYLPTPQRNDSCRGSRWGRQEKSE